MAAKKFSLAELIAEGKVPELGTKPQRQIEYIDFNLIDSDPNNFYELSDLPQLASNIELFGLQQPLLVRTNPDDPSRVIIVSGHRRRAAMELLIEKEGREDLRSVPCIREEQTGSAAFNELMLIYANSDTRKMTSAEINKETQRVEQLLYQLKEEGYEFPGRMRDHVAEACKVSKSKLARLKVIRDDLADAWKSSYEKNDLGESVAYELAKLPQEYQQRIHEVWRSHDKPVRHLYGSQVETFGKRLAEIDALECKKCGSACTNRVLKQEKAILLESWSRFPCGKCCSKCDSLAKCKLACPRLADKVKKLKEDIKLQKQQEKLAQAERDRPEIEAIMALWDRFGKARAVAGKSVQACYNAAGVKYSIPSEDEVMALECLEAKYTPQTKLPYGYNCYLSDIHRLTKVADLLGCSLDYLLCRTDDPNGLNSASDAERTGIAWYPASVEPKSGTEVVVIDDLGCADNGKYFSGGSFDGTVRWKEVVLWTPAPGPGVLDLPAAVLPAEGWVPLAWIPGMERPEKDGQRAAGKFMAPGMDKPLERIVVWDEFTRQWKFPNDAGTVECECVGWFPIPEDV